MRGGTTPVIGPGNAAASRLYLRLIGSQYGLQMPPTGALRPEQIDVIKNWIDQGAEWPDQFSGETAPAPRDPSAARLMEALRNGDRPTFQKLLRENPKAANLKGPGGSTPLMYAALYGDAAAVRLLLEKGADPNLRNDASATALMWAIPDLEKTQLLIEHGADVNARSDDARTPLLIAAGRTGSRPVVKLLIDRGANPSAKAPGNVADRNPLTEAASSADEEVIRLLIEKGADAKAAAPLGLSFAAAAGCTKCADLLLAAAGPEMLNAGMLAVAPPGGDAHMISAMLERGANANAKDPAGRTILMLAANSDSIPVASVKALTRAGRRRKREKRGRPNRPPFRRTKRQDPAGGSVGPQRRARLRRRARPGRQTSARQLPSETPWNAAFR